MGEVLPKNWVETNLGDVSTKPQYGWTSKAVYDGGVKYLRTTDLSKGRVDWDLVPFCLIEPDQVSKYQLHHNDILVSRAGSVGLSYRIVSPPQNAVFASYLIRLKPLINAKYVEFYLRSNNYWQQISDASAGIAVQNINAPKICALRIPVAPLPEQERIANKLDTLFAQIDNVRRATDRIPQLLKNLRQQILTHAITGKLTAEWRNGNDTSSWEMKQLKDIAIPRSGYAFKSFEFTDSGIQVIRMGNLYGNKLSLERSPVFVDTNYDSNIVNKYKLNTNDILLTLTGTKYKRDYGYAIKINTDTPLLLNQRILSLTPQIDADFLMYLLREESFRDCFFSFETGGVNQGNVGVQNVMKISMLIPPQKEQEAIVEKATTLFEQLDNIEERYERLTQKLKDLPQSLLHKAFKGELVPQFPTDGSAADLLREIETLNKTITKRKK